MNGVNYMNCDIEVEPISLSFLFFCNWKRCAHLFIYSKQLLWYFDWSNVDMAIRRHETSVIWFKLFIIVMSSIKWSYFNVVDINGTSKHFELIVLIFGFSKNRTKDIISMRTTILNFTIIFINENIHNQSSVELYMKILA